jgi:hypothetical protein
MVTMATNIAKECQTKRVDLTYSYAGKVEVDAHPDGYQLYQLATPNGELLFMRIYDNCDDFDVIKQSFHGFRGDTPVVRSDVIAAGYVADIYGDKNDIYVCHTLTGETVIIEIMVGDDGGKTFTYRSFGTVAIAYGDTPNSAK